MTSTNPLEVVDELLDDNVAPLDVHDGGDRLLGRTQQCGTKTDAQVGHGHQVLVGELRHSVHNKRCTYSNATSTIPARHLFTF